MRNGFLAVVVALALSQLACAQASLSNIEARERILMAARSLIGTTESSGRNDGRKINEILARVGLQGTGAPYCAAFNRWCYDQAGLLNIGPRSAWAPDWIQKATWTAKAAGYNPLPGDTWGVYFASKGRVAHTGIVEKWGQSVAMTIEGNTSPDAVAGSEIDRNGDGIWRKRRLKRQIYAVRNWLLH